MNSKFWALAELACVTVSGIAGIALAVLIVTRG